MYCSRCKQAVSSEFEKLGLRAQITGAGEIKTRNGVSAAQKEKLRLALERAGFELVDEKKSKIIEKLTSLLTELVHYSEEQLNEYLPEYLSKKLNYDYTYLSNLFYEVKNTTIEKFFVDHKIEMAKELLVYYRLNLTEIAYQLNYNSVTGLSNQFKAVTGFPPCHFQEIKRIRHITQVMCE